MSDHDEVRELLELASVEPGGLDRLEAGDTPEAVLVAGHVAGCPSCLEELARLRRAETLLRPILAAEPDPALRERTLAFVRTVGVKRSGQDAGPEDVAVAGREGPAHDRPGRRRTVGVPAWAGTLAAALVIGLLGGVLLVGGGRGNAADTAFETVALETAQLYSAGDAHEIVLDDSAGTPAGTLLLSPSAGRMLVTATGLAKPAAGAEYRCWVAVGDGRRTIGTMQWADGVGWWAGDVALPAGLPAGATYGVSLATEGSSDPGTVLLTTAP
jgi:Anti-sigma-K factor rskA, C-terminal